MSLPAANRALVAAAVRGSQDVRDFPHDPLALADNEVAVKLHSAGLNSIDYKILKFGIIVPESAYPQVFGLDGAGVVAAVGKDVTKHSVGDRVFFQGCLGVRRSSAFQEHAALPEHFVYKLPEGVSFDQGATFGVTGFTAAAGLFKILKAPKWWAGEAPVDGKHLLVWGGASGLGRAVIQLASRAGFTVIATASPAHHADLLSVGAAHVFDYRSPTVAADIRAVAGDALQHAYDAVGFSTPTVFSLLSSSLPAKICLAVNEPDKLDAAIPDRKDFPNRTYERVFGSSWANRPLAEEFWGAFVELLQNGEFKPQKAKVVGGLDKVVEAQQDMMAGKVSNFKFVVRVQE